VPAASPAGAKQAVAKGPVKDVTPWTERWRRRRRAWWYPSSIERTVKRYVRRAAFVVFMWFGAPYLLPGLARASEASANLAESLSGVAGTAAWAGANLTKSATEWVTVSSSSALSVASQVWHGVDLIDLRIEMQKGGVITDDLQAMASYVMGEGKNLVSAQTCHRTLFAEALWATSERRPLVALSWEDTSVHGTFSVLHAKVRLLETGLSAVSWASVNVTFQPQWVNPWWDVLRSPIDREAEQIFSRLRKALQALKIDDSLLLNLSVPHTDEIAAPYLFFTSAARRWRAFNRALRRGRTLLWSGGNTVALMITPWEWDFFSFLSGATSGLPEVAGN